MNKHNPIYLSLKQWVKIRELCSLERGKASDLVEDWDLSKFPITVYVKTKVDADLLLELADQE